MFGAEPIRCPARGAATQNGGGVGDLNKRCFTSRFRDVGTSELRISRTELDAFAFLRSLARSEIFSGVGIRLAAIHFEISEKSRYKLADSGFEAE